MPRLFFDEVTGWWSVPLDGEAAPVRWLGHVERGRDNPPPMVPPPGSPDLPNGDGDELPDELPGWFENEGPAVGDDLRGLWYEVALAGERGEYEPLGEGEFDALEYQQAQECTVPAQHPPPGTLIGFPNAPGSTHDPNVPPNNWQSDNAVDIWLYPGTVVRACAAGRVSTSLGFGQMGDDSSRFGGKRLHVEHASGMISFYTHLERITTRRGAHVRRGQAIGRSGFGACVPHLHFAVTPPFDPRAWATITYRRGAPPNPPPPPVEPPEAPPPIPRRTPDESWNNLMVAIGPDRRRQRQRVNAARRAVRRALS